MDDRQAITRPEPLDISGFSVVAASASALPSAIDDRRTLGAAVTDYINGFFEKRLSPEDRALLYSNDPWPKRILGALDNTIIERAQTLGWLVYLSTTVQERMSRWHNGHEHGPLRLQQLGEAVALAARVARGEGQLPISEPEWKQNKATGVSDLRRLFKRYRSFFSLRRRPPSYQEACEWLRKTIEESPKAFPFLSVSVDSLFRYFEFKQQDADFARQLVLGNIKPATLFDQWGAHGRGLSPETFRQSISSLPPEKL